MYIYIYIYIIIHTGSINPTPFGVPYIFQLIRLLLKSLTSAKALRSKPLLSRERKPQREEFRDPKHQRYYPLLIQHTVAIENPPFLLDKFTINGHFQ